MLAINLDKDIMDEIKSNPQFILTNPVSFFDILLLEKYSKIVITDSGGVQKESYFFRKPCIVLRKESEWKELLDAGTAILADADEERIISAYRLFDLGSPATFPPIFGDGKAAEFIFNEMYSLLTN
jgi:UDP-GlcNAc3NAcA epimerase